MSAMDHVRYLAQEIGTRGSTTSGEEEAAHYAADALCDAGLTPTIEWFTSARSAWLPYTISFGLILVGELLFWVGGRWGAVAALALTLLALGSVLLELAFRPNPLRWALPKGESQNVWARVAPREEVQEEVVLLAHLDTHRTPVVFSSRTWVRLFKILIPAGVVSVLVLSGLLTVDLIVPRPLWETLSLVPTVAVVGVVVLTMQAERSPYTVGANDNASGVGVVLSLARRLAEQPLKRTAVWAVLTGCEEVGCYGAEAFAEAHADDLGRPVWMAVDNVGGPNADPTWAERELFFLPVKSDRQLLALAEEVANRRPDLGARGADFELAYTEGAIGGKYGFRVLTLLALRGDGSLPHWHRPSDVMKNVDSETVARTEAFAWELLRAIDDAS